MHRGEERKIMRMTTRDLQIVAAFLGFVSIASIGVGALGIWKGTRPSDFYETGFDTSAAAAASATGACDETAHRLIVHLNAAARKLAFFLVGVGFSLAGLATFLFRALRKTHSSPETPSSDTPSDDRPR